MNSVQVEEIDLIYKDIENECGVLIRRGVDAKRFTTMAIRCTLDSFAEPEDVDALRSLLKSLNRHNVSYRCLGAGSNIILPDSDVNDLVIRLGKGFKILSPMSEGVFEVGAAYSFMNLSRKLSEAGYSGLEFAGGIPASFGGAVRMNAGAHGGETVSVLRSIRVARSSGDIEEYSPEALSFSYRNSGLALDAIVIGGEIELAEGNKERSATLRTSMLKERKERQPLTMPSSGSVFKNPSPEETAGMLIERAGLKGHKIGEAEISKLHANWIINPNRKAKSSEVKELIEYVQTEVVKKFTIELEPEVIMW